MQRDDALILLKEENFDLLIRNIKDKFIFKKLMEDPIFKIIFEENLLNAINNSSKNEEYKAICIKMLNDYHINIDHSFQFKETDLDIVGQTLLSNFPSVDIARQFPNLSISQEILAEYNKKAQEDIAKNLDDARIKKEYIFNQVSNRNIESKKYSKSIFNSPQEEYIFEALIRNSDNQYLILPNISLPTIIAREIAQDLGMNKFERDFFLRTSVDISIVDKEDYRVLIVVELDSSFHDEISQMEKDVLKNKIFKKSEIEMFRIRQKDWSKHPNYDEIAISIISKAKKQKATC